MTSLSPGIVQKNLMKDLAEGYEPSTGPAMLVSRADSSILKHYILRSVNKGLRSMKDKEFVGAVFDELFDKNFEQYKEALIKPVSNDNDAYARARNALSFLGDSQRQDVIDFLKIVIADSASVILGALDGVHYPDNLEGDFVLSCGGEEIQGDLQDFFIEKAQKENVYG